MFDENKLKEVADRYNLIARKVDNKEEAGFFVNGKKVSDNELFELLFSDQLANGARIAIEKVGNLEESE